MKKMSMLCLIIGCIGLLMMGGTARASMTMPFGDGNITFQGYMENLSGLRLGDYGEGHVAIFRNTFQPEFIYSFADGNSLYVSGRFVKETDYEMEEMAGIANDYYDETEFEPWELHLDLKLGDSIKLITGKQYIIWGETDVFRLLDVINPADGSWNSPAMVSLEDKRVPIYAARMVWSATPVTSLELVFVPMIDDQDRLVDKSAPAGGRWAVHGEDRAPAAAVFGTNFPQMNADIGAAIGASMGAGITNFSIGANSVTRYPEKSLDDSRVGIRFSTRIGRVDVSIMDYYTHISQNPVAFYDGTTSEVRAETSTAGATPVAGSVVNTTYITPQFSLRYPRQNIRVQAVPQAR